MSQCYLEITAGQSVSQFPLGHDPVSVGRQDTCTLVIHDPMASRAHCVIEHKGSGYQVRDLKSKNGTLVNGNRIGAVPLTSGDIIRIGAISLKFVDPDASDNDVEMLSMEDLVEIEEAHHQHHDRPIPMTAMLDDPEKALESLAQSLPDQSFREGDVVLINSRGVTIHEANNDKRKGKREPVDLFRLLLLVCIRSRTTDIHIEPRQDSYGIRLRIDGSMVDVAKVPSPFGVRMNALVKVVSDIDIAQRNSIQEGHFSSRVPSPKSVGGSRRIDYRVSFAPSVFGQKLVIRILDAENAPLKLGDLNLPRWMYDELSEQIKQDAGMVLVTGPTGSGKSTTLYSLLRSIELHRRNVVTIEDPVEVQVEGTTQIPVDESQGKGFPAILRSVLRQDPDVIMLGEIRDAETARTAMQASITGHMVLSTLHTRDTLGTVFRLLDLGVEPFLVSQGLQVVIAQRLVRQLCPFCRRKVTPTADQRAAMGAVGKHIQNIYVPHGCPKCLGTGHAGRRACFELLRTNDAMRERILSNPSTADLQVALADTPFISLAQSGYQLVADGVASFEEVEKVVGREKSRP